MASKLVQQSGKMCRAPWNMKEKIEGTEKVRTWRGQGEKKKRKNGSNLGFQRVLGIGQELWESGGGGEGF